MRKALEIVIQFLAILTIATAVGCSSPGPTSTPTPTLPSPSAPIVSPTVSQSPLTTVSPKPTVSSSPLLTPTLMGASSISIIQPRTGTYVVGTDKIAVVVQVSGFELVDKIGQLNVPGQGHINYFIQADSPGAQQVTAPGAYASSAATTYTWMGLAEGAYTFSVELVNNDNTPLAPPASASSTVEVYPG